MAQAFASVRIPASTSTSAPAFPRAPAREALDLVDGWKLLALWLPRAAGPPDIPFITIPEALAHDDRGRMAFKAGVLAARELELDAADFSTEELVALGQETIGDHVLSGASADVLVTLARLEGKVDEAAWRAGDKETIARQVGAFVQAYFKDEIELHGALEAMTAEPPLLSRRALADELLRRQGIDPDALLEGNGQVYAYGDINGLTPGLLLNWRAGEFYFNSDKLRAETVGRMRMLDGSTPAPAHIARVLAGMPASLDAEFGKRFDAHKQRMSAALAKWLAARLSMHANEVGTNLAGATVTISRAHKRYYRRVTASMISGQKVYHDVYGNMPSRGFVVTINGTHRCFISSRTGAVHVIPPAMSTQTWLARAHERVFEDAAPHAGRDLGPGQWDARVDVEESVSGAHANLQEWLSRMFQADIEAQREALRGQTSPEAAVEILLDLIPFRAMVVALRKGDLPSAIVMGGLDVLSLLPLIGFGVRLTGAMARAAAPWLSMGLRLGTRLAGRAADGLRQLADSLPVLHDTIRTALARGAIHGWGRLRPLDVARVAQAMRSSAPRLAGLLEAIAARARPATIPDGVWRVGRQATVAADTAARETGSLASAAVPSPAVGTVAVDVTAMEVTAMKAAAMEAADAIVPLSMVTARNHQGQTLALLPYDQWGSTFTQVDAAGGRIGPLLVADSAGWLHEAMPVASLERYRVASPGAIAAVDAGRVGVDGTILVHDAHYARLGSSYVEVRRDAAVSSSMRPIWRAVAPEGVMPDLVAHRLAYDVEEGLWRRAQAPALAGGHRPFAVRPLAGSVASADELRATPTAARLGRFRDVVMSSLRGATPLQVQAVRALWDWLASNHRGLAILNAMTAHYELLGEAPEIILRVGANATGPRPTVDQPVHGNQWYVDLDALRQGTTDEAVGELAAVYNNMTGLLQDRDPFAALLAGGGPALDPHLERAWTTWLGASGNGAQGGSRTAAWPARRGPETGIREMTVAHLRTRLRQMRCYGGLDRDIFKLLLRRPETRSIMRIHLDGRGLDSVPPLPPDTGVLFMSHNPIQDWSNLPAGLLALHAEGTHMLALPANLPAGLQYLNVSNNFLRGASLGLPAGLVRLEIARNGLTRLPTLPATLKELIASENNLAALPEQLPAGLQLLHAGDNDLTQVPASLPDTLKHLLLGNNRLSELPALPAGLEELDVSLNRFQVLPPLPDSLRILDARSNALSALPDNLPGGLDVLVLGRNRLRRLPARLPARLTYLGLQHNALEMLPAYITTLRDCRIHMDGNPLAAGGIPPIPPGEIGPRILFTPPGSVYTTGRLTLSQVVRHWWIHAAEDAQARWDAIDGTVGMQDKAKQFTQFLLRLRGTSSYTDPVFRTRMAEWLAEISKPERATLLDETLAVCRGATETCDDRVISVWNDLQVLHRNDDIRQGLYDGRVGEVVEIARQMFRINVLNEIARNKERVLANEAARAPVGLIDPLEVYLSYMVHLREALGLKLLASRMRFYDASTVTPADLIEATGIVRQREKEEFDMFLVLDYEPWQTLLKRKDAQAYARAEEAAHEALEARFEQALQAEVAKLGLPADDALVADVRKDLGPRLMREIRYAAMAPLTRALLDTFRVAGPVGVARD